MFDPRWLTVVGLLSDIIGASFLAWGLFISEQRAVELETPWYAEELQAAGRRAPMVADRLRQAHNAKIGLTFLVIGFVLQVVGSWPR